MIQFITDTQPGEPDVLSKLQFKELRIQDLEGHTILNHPAPEEGWTHERLTLMAEKLSEETVDGAEGYLGNEWVGSTEV
jgi:hypothetical protein